MKKDYKDNLIQQKLDEYADKNRVNRSVLAEANVELANSKRIRTKWYKVLAPIACCLILGVTLLLSGVFQPHDGNMSFLKQNPDMLYFDLPRSTAEIVKSTTNKTVINIEDPYSTIVFSAVTPAEEHKTSQGQMAILPTLTGTYESISYEYSVTPDGEQYRYNISFTKDNMSYDIIILSDRDDMLEYYLDNLLGK